MNRPLLLSVAILFLPIFLLAQSSNNLSKTVAGKVILAPDQMPLAGASIKVLGLNLGVSTDADGFFVLPAEAVGETLEISYPLLQTQRVVAFAHQLLTVNMQEQTTRQLDRAVNLSARLGDDLHHWKAWQVMLGKNGWSYYEDAWGMYLRNRITVIAQDRAGLPVSGVTASLKGISGALIWESKTNHEGKAELWPNFYGKKLTEKMEVVLSKDGETLKTLPLRNLNAVMQVALPIESKPTYQTHWEVLALDASANDLASRVGKEITLTVRALNGQDLGSYRKNTAHRWERAAIEKAGSLSWGKAVSEAVQAHATSSVLFVVVADNLTLNESEIVYLKQAIRMAAAKGIRIVPVFPVTVNRDTEFLLRFVALTTQGGFLAVSERPGEVTPLATTLPDAPESPISQTLHTLLRASTRRF